MNKGIIFSVIVALGAIMAFVENATIGLPVVNYPILTICGVCLCLGLVYMRVSLYHPQHILWCLLGGVALTIFVVFGTHFANSLPRVIDYLHLGPLASLLLVIFTALYIIGVYAASLYLFVFYFCELRERIKDFE